MFQGKIGNLIRDLRQSNGIKLKGLAARTGLTPSFISQVEREIVSPSLSSLDKIASALKVPLGYFFKDEMFKDLVIVREKERHKVINDEYNSSCENLIPGLTNTHCTPLLFTLSAGGETGRQLRAHRGDEFGIVLKGKVKVEIDSKEFMLQKGDSIYCRYGHSQRVINAGNDEAKFLWIVPSVC